MDPESSLYIMSALAHQNIYPIRRVIQRNQAYISKTVPWNLFLNKRSGAVIMSPDSEWLVAAVVAGVGSNLYFFLPTIYMYIV